MRLFVPGRSKGAMPFTARCFSLPSTTPEWSVVIKAKAGTRSLAYLEEQWKALGKAKPANVRMTNSEDAAELIRTSRAVINFMSTTSVEALVAGRRVISPDFSDLFQDIPWDYFSDYPELVAYTGSADDIREALARIDDSRDGLDDGMHKTRSEFLEVLVNGADGKASERACREIAATVDRGFQEPPAVSKLPA